MIRDLHCTEYQATIGLSVFALGFGLIPLVTASFSEEFGRQPLYIGSGLGFLLMYPMIALYVELHANYGHATHLEVLQEQKISKRLLRPVFYKERSRPLGRLWSVERSLIYGRVRSMLFDDDFAYYHVQPFL